MKQLQPKLKKNNCKKLISKKKSQIDRATTYINDLFLRFSACFQGQLTCCYVYKLQKSKLRSWCLNFNPVRKEEIQVSTSTLNNLLKMHQKAMFRPCFRNFPLEGRALLRPSRTLPATTPHNISTPKNKDTPLILIYPSYC